CRAYTFWIILGAQGYDFTAHAQRDWHMPGLSKLLGFITNASDLASMGSAACVGLVAALAHVTRRPPYPAGSGSLVPAPGVLDAIPRVLPDGPHAAPHTALELRTMLNALLADRQVIVLSNREPCIHELANDGAITVRRPASGVVTALEPVVCACDGVWVAH